MADVFASQDRRTVVLTSAKRTLMMHKLRLASVINTLALSLSTALHRRAAPERLDHIRDDSHAVRRLRHRAWAILGEEMRPLQHALLWG